jgi:hypothetical protein
MKISQAFLNRRDDSQAEKDRQAEAKATAPTLDSRTGEYVQHCTGRNHKWNPLRSPRALVCDRCGAIKLRDR